MLQVSEIQPSFVFSGFMLSSVQKMSSSEFLRFFGVRAQNFTRVLDEDPAELQLKQEGISTGRLFGLTPSRHRHRPNENKPATLRSWRNPRCVGGDNRKGVIRKLTLRMPQKNILGQNISS